MRGWGSVTVVAGACVAAASSAAADQARPTVRATSTSPFLVRGAHFQPYERVKVTVYAKAGAEKTTAASSVGSFVLRFRGVNVGYCPAYSIAAVGNKGSRASFKFRATDCPPPADPVSP